MSKPLITLIGNGKMALSIAKGLKNNYSLEIIGRTQEALDQFEASLECTIQKTLYEESTCDGKTIIVCVKPPNLPEISTRLQGKARALYSVLAGTPLSSLHCISAVSYVRAMPNLAAEIGLSMTALVGDISLQEEAIILFSSIGKTLWLGSEKELDIATALAGSGPAYLALIAEALTDGAVREGLKRDDAMTLMRGLFEGFGVQIQNTHPALLKDKVMSPGGTTAAGYGALEKSGVRNGCMEAIHLAYEKTKTIK